MVAPDIKKSPLKVYLYYAIGALVLFMVISFLGLIPGLSVRTAFLLMLVAYLVAGIAHIYLIHEFLPGLDAQKRLLYTVVLTLLGFIVVFILNRYILPVTSYAIYALSLVIFPLPLLFGHTFSLYLNIPARIYKKWYFPVDHTMPDLDLLDLSRVLIIQLEFLRTASEGTRTNFKAKAPHNMPFGELFRIFISDYNESHPQNTIEIVNEQHIPYPWVFYIKTPWWKRDRYIDPDLTFQDNRIGNNDIILCQRVSPE